LNIAPAPANSVTILKGVVTNAETGAFVSATIRVVQTSRNEEVSQSETNSASGRYLTTLPSGGQYAIFVEAEGFLFHSEHFDIPVEMGFQEVIKDIQLKPIKRGATIVLRNIFFDHDKATLRDESQAELQELIKVLRENPTLTIRINGHTDSNGDDAYNLDLSNRRAKAVVTYLIDHGIPAARLQSQGFGESRPIDTNETDAGRQNNRRTEFEIMSF
jgi:outer membrane protein OmpA-like peptidoglycan-associated protein